MMNQEAKDEEQRVQHELAKPLDAKTFAAKKLPEPPKGLMSDANKRHFKQLTSFINAYRMKMTQSSSNSHMARAIAMMSGSRGDKD